MWTKPTTAKQKTPVPEEKYEEQKSLERYELEKQTKLLINLPEELKVWSLESLCELEKQTKLLINLPEELKSGRSRVCVSSRSRRNC